jgi:hypothetical protein
MQTRQVNDFDIIVNPHKVAADCASKWTTPSWIAALANGNRFDLTSTAQGITELFSGNRWEQHCKWLVTDDQLYVADLFNCAGCLDSSL